MKKVIALLLACVLAFAMVACGGGEKPDVKGEGVMTYAEYAAAALDTEVTIEAYVQAKQGWWEKDGVGGVATIYAQDAEGGYFFYEMHEVMPCAPDVYIALSAVSIANTYLPYVHYGFRFGVAVDYGRFNVERSEYGQIAPFDRHAGVWANWVLWVFIYNNFSCGVAC